MNKPRRTPTRKDGAETKQKLIAAAERLFTAKGVENVKLVDVNREAEQKNRNAAQYHFGDRIGLLNAVLDRHTNQIAVQRREMLDHLDVDGASLRDLVDILVLPFAEHVASDPNGPTFLRLNRYMLSEHFDLGWRRSSSMPEVRELQHFIRHKMPPRPPGTMQAKMTLVQCMLFNGLASFYDLNPDGPSRAMIETLCRGIEAVLLLEGDE